MNRRRSSNTALCRRDEYRALSKITPTQRGPPGSRIGKMEWEEEIKACVTKHAGSQYRCGWVGRGIQPPSIPQTTSNIQIYTKSIKNARFQLDRHDGPTNQRTNRPTDGPTDGRTKPLIELRVRN